MLFLHQPCPKYPGRFDGLVAGDCEVRVQSGVDCATVSLPVTVTPTNALVIATKVITNVTCNGQNDGKVNIVAIGGTGQIKYSISPQSNQF
jgi:hypothetical protein